MASCQGRCLCKLSSPAWETDTCISCCIKPEDWNGRSVVQSWYRRQDASHATPLHHAIFGQNNEIRMLIQNGAFLEAKTLCDDLTPLHIATIDGTDDSVMLLTDLSASVN